MKSERIGLMMVVASLVAIALVIGLFLIYQRDMRLGQVRVQGVSLVRLLSSMPYARLVPGAGQQGPLAIIRSTQSNSDFAYAVVEDGTGTTRAQTTAPGVIVPAVAFAAAPAEWFGERDVAGGGRAYREFHAPILSQGERVGRVRVGYFAPRLLASEQGLPFFAMLALPVFLLVPLFYLALRRELSSLKTASEQIQGMLNDQPIREVELKASGEVGEFVRNFNRVAQAAEQRIRDLEGQQAGMLTSSKVLSYQKARTESVLQALPEAVIVLDETGGVTFASHKVDGVLGVDHVAIVGREPGQWCQDPDLLGLLLELGRHRGRRVQGGRLELTPRAAPDKRIAVSAFPLFSPREEGTVYGSMVVLRDVTSEVLARDARKEFVAHLAHELKTPLHVVGMYAEMLREDDADLETIRIEAGNVIQDEVERMTALIRNMLSITEIEMGSIVVSRTRTRWRDLLEDILEGMRRAGGERDIHLRLEVPAELSPASVDKDLMRVAINNLMTNAVKYNRPGGEVVLSAEERDREFVISVRDTGIGIAEDDLAHVFDRFFRAENEATRSQGGHGLGLALAKEIVVLHNGELRVRSTPGQGSEFSIMLSKTANLLKEAV